MLDERILPLRVEQAQRTLTKVQAEFEKLKALPPDGARPATMTSQNWSVSKERENHILESCTSRKEAIGERLRQALQKEQARLDAFTKRIADPGRRRVYWNTRTKWENYQMLIRHWELASQLALLDARVVSLALEAQQLAPQSDAELWNSLSRTGLDTLAYGCIEFQFVQEMYSSVKDY